MTEDKLLKMEQWYTTMVLMGHDMNSIYDDWDSDDTVHNLLHLEEQRLKRLANPDDNVRAFLLTLEMGVTCDDIDMYNDYRQEQEELQLRAEREERERNNPSIKALEEIYNFKFITAKQYPKHKHFTFKDKNGFDFTGRLFNPCWGRVRVWLTFKNSKGNKQAFRWDAKATDMVVPKYFPHEWQDYGYTSDLNKVARIVAHWAAEHKMPKAAQFNYPK